MSDPARSRPGILFVMAIAASLTSCAPGRAPFTAPVSIRSTMDTAVAPTKSADSPFSEPAWTASQSEPTWGQGAAIASAGDVDGDGYDDVAVGSMGVRTHIGPVVLYAGSASGLSSAPTWSATSNDGGWFGYSLASAGDVNADGYDDLLVGTGSHDYGHHAAGHVHLFLGSSSGLIEEAAWITESHYHWARYGMSVSSAGDVDGDGYDDVVVGAPWQRDPDDMEASGCVLVFHGSSSGLPTTASWSRCGDEMSDEFGRSVAGAMDVDGDGYGDIVVAGSEYAKLYLGSSDGLQDGSWDVEGLEPSWSIVASAGDVDGDGRDDVLLSAEHSNAEVTLHSGSEKGLSSDWQTVELPLSNTASPTAISAAGDVNADGYDDVLVGCQAAFPGLEGERVAFLFLGSADGLSTRASIGRGPGGSEPYGGAVSNAGDVDGDGHADILVGTEESTQSGGAWQYAGMPCVEDGAWYPDADGDGHPVDGPAVTWCYRPAGYAGQTGTWDCDDDEATVYPGAPEIRGDGIDQDCDGEDAERLDSPVLDTGDSEVETGEAPPPDQPDECGCASHRGSGLGAAFLAILGAVGRRQSGTCGSLSEVPTVESPGPVSAGSVPTGSRQPKARRTAATTRTGLIPRR